MFNKVNYMDEINRIKGAIELIDEKENGKDRSAIRGRLNVMLYNLEQAAEDMASYINGAWDEEALYFIKQSNNINLKHNNYQEYLFGLTRLLRLERIMLICSTQTPEEKMYFLEEYNKYKKEKEDLGPVKVR